jgi:hypothetical protein
VKNPLDLKVPARWRDLGKHDVFVALPVNRDGKGLYGVCADSVDLGTGLLYTTGWLNPDGQKLRLSSTLRKFFVEASKVEECVDRAVVAYRAIVQVLDNFVPEVKRSQVLRLRKSRSDLWISFLRLSLEDKLEKELKSDLCKLLSYGTKKSTDRSISVFSGFIRKMLLTHAIRMNCEGKTGRKAASFIRSLYESKRCWNEMSGELRLQSMNKHRDLLSTPYTCSEEAKVWISSAVNLIIPPGTKYRPSGLCVPTWSASYETSCKDGGNHSSLLRDGRGKTFELGDMKGQREFSDKFEYELLCGADEEENDVKYQSIPEPGKFRVITVGREKLYSSFRVFQRFLIDLWKNSQFSTMDRNVFSLICGLREMEGDTYFSGDYSDATDGLSLEASIHCISEVLKNLGIFETFLGKQIIRSFSGAVIHYPDGTSIRQLRGQLMGHPLSFPLLCIINLSTYLRAKNIRFDGDKRKRRRVLRSLRRVIINGDDILFKDSREYENEMGFQWRSAAEEVGLKVNEAKTYESSRWALINSIFVDMTVGKEIHYLPLSVCIGHNVKRGEVNQTIGQASQLWELACGFDYDRGRRMCQRLLLKQLGRLSPKIGSFVPNYFLHKDLGGFGLRVVDGWKFGVSYEQRKVASYFLRNRLEFSIKEKFHKMPRAVESALVKLRKLTPISVPFILGSRPIYGPLREGEDVQLYLDSILPMVLRSTCWEVGAGESMDYVCFNQYRKALRNKEEPLSSKKTLSYFPARQISRICTTYATTPFPTKRKFISTKGKEPVHGDHE